MLCSKAPVLAAAPLGIAASFASGVGGIARFFAGLPGAALLSVLTFAGLTGALATGTASARFDHASADPGSMPIDARIRAKTGDRKSLDDFAASFFGTQDGRVDVLPYTFDDVVAALNAVQPYDWATFLHDRVDKVSARPPLDGLARGGWKLVYTDKKNEAADRGNRGMPPGGASLTYSLGMSTDKDNKVTSVLWDSVAFKAGLAPGMVIVGVNGDVATTDRLTDAVTAAKGQGGPIVLLVNSFDHLSTITLDYHGGLLYPHLERIDGTPDRLTQIHTPKK